MEEEEKMVKSVTSLKKYALLQVSIESGKTAASANCMHCKRSTKY